MQRRLMPRWAAFAAGAWLATASCGGDDGPIGPDPDDGPDPNAVATVAVSPSTATIDVGGTVQLAASPTNSQGGGVSATVSWSSSATSVATVASTGLVTGVGAGSATITASAGGRSGTATITVTDPTLSISTEALDTARVGVAYSFDLGTDGGAGAITWSVSAGSLPPGITVGQSSGLISGTATAVGTFTFTLTAQSGDGQTASKAFELLVAPGPVTITKGSLPGAVVSAPYSDSLTATGGDGENYDFTVQSGAMPDGIDLAITGAVTGTPTAVGTFTFTVLVDSRGETATKEYTITVASAPPVTIQTPTVLPSAVVGTAYSTSLSATGGDGTYSWSIEGGVFPPGLSLNAANGVISGTPTTSGDFAFTAKASSAGQEGTKALSLTVNAAPQAGFQIDLVYKTTFTGSILAAFESARSRWEGILTTDLPDNLGTLDAACGNPAVTTPVDDLTIFVDFLSAEDADGPGGVLGSAGPCYIRTASTLPITGQMNFDEADLQNMADGGILTEVILHEMGHVLGIGTLWVELGLLSGDCTIDPFFTGAAATSAYDAAGGPAAPRSKVPVHKGPDPEDGSVCGHWEETILGNELMTPSIGGPGSPLSAITIGSLGDMGYGVNMGAADAYAVPAPVAVSMSQGARTRVFMRDDVYRGPIYRVGPDGRVEEVKRRR